MTNIANASPDDYGFTVQREKQDGPNKHGGVPLSLKQVLDALHGKGKLGREINCKTKILRDLTEAQYDAQDRDKILPSLYPCIRLDEGEPVIGAARFSGRYVFDLDKPNANGNPPDVAAIIAALKDCLHCELAAESVSGRGAYAVLRGPIARDSTHFVSLAEAMAAALPPLAYAHAHVKGQTNPNRQRFLARSELAFVNSDAVPYFPAEPLTEVVAPTASTPEPAKRRYTPSQGDNGAIDREALSWIAPPQEYHLWLGWLPTLRELGFSVVEVDAWSRQGASYQPGEVERRWDRLPPRDSVEGCRNQLRGHAYNLGWRNPELHKSKTQRDRMSYERIDMAKAFKAVQAKGGPMRDGGDGVYLLIGDCQRGADEPRYTFQVTYNGLADDTTWPDMSCGVCGGEMLKAGPGAVDVGCYRQEYQNQVMRFLRHAARATV